MTWHATAVALTGTIGSGKSTASKILQKLGAFVLSADDLARRAVEKGSPTLEQIRQEFGPEAIAADGTLNRKWLAERVFANPAERKKLEQITHPRIRELAAEAFAEAGKKSYPLLVYDCPLLFEAGLDKLGFKKIVLVTAPRELCLDRIIKRDNLTREQAEKRLDAQMPIEAKSLHADIIVENTGTPVELEEKMTAVFKALQS